MSCLIYQPLKKGNRNFSTPRPLEPFLVDLMQSGFCEKTLYIYLAWVPQNPLWNLSIVEKMRGEFSKSVMKFYNTKLDWPCTCIVNFGVLPFAKFWSGLAQNWYGARFYQVVCTLQISCLYLDYGGRYGLCIISNQKSILSCYYKKINKNADNYKFISVNDCS